jgi:hypothetical protein
MLFQERRSKDDIWHGMEGVCVTVMDGLGHWPKTSSQHHICEILHLVTCIECFALHFYRDIRHLSDVSDVVPIEKLDREVSERLLTHDKVHD